MKRFSRLDGRHAPAPVSQAGALHLHGKTLSVATETLYDFGSFTGCFRMGIRRPMRRQLTIFLFMLFVLGGASGRQAHAEQQNRGSATCFRYVKRGSKLPLREIGTPSNKSLLMILLDLPQQACALEKWLAS
jgi:hypothetical protein